jgi:hypothetical protein
VLHGHVIDHQEIKAIGNGHVARDVEAEEREWKGNGHGNGGGG